MDEQHLIKGTEVAVGRAVAGIELKKLAGDASTRNFYRISYGDGQSLVLMELGQPNPQDQADLVAVWDYFDRQRLEVPKLHHQDPERGWLWFEDLGDLILQEFASKASDLEIYRYYRQAIDLVLKIQQAGVLDSDPKCPAFGRAFDIEKLSWELNFFQKYMLEKNLKLVLPENDKSHLQNFFLELSRRLAAEPRYLTHRDYHSRNLMVQDDRLRLVDYQDARLGPCQYDLASLLRDSYVALDEAMGDNLLEYYICRKEEWEHKPIDRRYFREIFDYTCIQRNLKAVGTFAYQHCIRKNPTYLQYIPRTLGYVARNMGKYPALKSARQTLGKYLPQIME